MFTIGISQIKSAFGFISVVPQLGQIFTNDEGVTENYDFQYHLLQWFVENWNDHDIKNRPYKNPLAMRVSRNNFLL